MNYSGACDWRSKRYQNHISIQKMNYSSYSLPETTKKEMEMYVNYDKIDKFTNKDNNMNNTGENLNSWLRSAARVYNVIKRRFWRASSPDLSYHDCAESPEPSPTLWQCANTENKNIQARFIESSSEMNGDSTSVVAACEDKLNKVRQLISSKGIPNPPKCSAYRSKRKKKLFVEAGSVEECFEDAFTQENFISISNSSAFTILVPLQCQENEYCVIAGGRVKTETGMPPKETEMPPNNTGTPPNDMAALLKRAVNLILPPKETNMTPKVTNIPHNEAGTPPIETIMPPCDIIMSETNMAPGKVSLEETTMPLKDTKESEVSVKSKTTLNLQPNIVDNQNTNETTKTQETIASCESKMQQLQALLQRKNKNRLNLHDSSQESDKERKTRVIPICQDKRFKNPNRLPEKRRKCAMKKTIQDDMLFADELNEDVSSFENSPCLKDTVMVNNMKSKANLPQMKETSLRLKCPLTNKSNDSLSSSPHLNMKENLPQMKESSPHMKCSLNKSNDSLSSLPHVKELSTSNEDDYFDEIAGRFRRNSVTESEDSFQVVFADSPRRHRPSDCDSEDSFIFFEDSPDSCYTSNDVFGDDSDSESEYSDSDTEVSDSGCSETHSMTRTVNDLTDTTLYKTENVDQVDCAARICEEVPDEELEADKSTGVLMNEAKKLLRKSLPPKKVQFSEKPPKVHVMRVWAFAARQARAGHWERHALDRDRFRRRIADADMALSWVLKPQHRKRVMFQRFMPWWNAQKRQEIAERKRKEEEKKLMEEQRQKEQQQREIEEKQKEIEGQQRGTEDDQKDITENQKDNQETKGIQRGTKDNQKTTEKQKGIEERQKSEENEIKVERIDSNVTIRNGGSDLMNTMTEIKESESKINTQIALKNVDEKLQDYPKNNINAGSQANNIITVRNSDIKLILVPNVDNIS